MCSRVCRTSGRRQAGTLSPGAPSTAAAVCCLPGRQQPRRACAAAGQLASTQLLALQTLQPCMLALCPCKPHSRLLPACFAPSTPNACSRQSAVLLPGASPVARILPQSIALRSVYTSCNAWPSLLRHPPAQQQQAVATAGAAHRWQAAAAAAAQQVQGQRPRQLALQEAHLWGGAGAALGTGRGCAALARPAGKGGWSASSPPTAPLMSRH